MTFSPQRSFHWPRARASLLHCGLWLILLAVSVCVPQSHLSAMDKAPPPQVIILNSYHPGFAWSDDEVAGVLQELCRDYPDIDPVIEYLDTKRFPSDEHLLKMKNFLASKYRGYQFDLVLALDNAALEMVLGHRAELFPGTPIVFAGINNFKPAMLAGQEKVTGVVETLDIDGTLKTALALHPKTTEIIVISDDTLSGKAAKEEVKAFMPRLPVHVAIKFAPSATMAELVEQIKRLPATSIIFISGFTTDKAGQSFSPVETGRLLSQNAKIPAYVVHKARLGRGPVGGMLLGGEAEGRAAGKIALRVLAGTDPSSIPVETKSTSQPMFDYRQLVRFKIPLAALPAGSIIINRPSSFYEIHRSLVWGTFAVVVALALVIIVLTVNITRRRRAELTLQNHFGFLQNLLDTIPNLVFYKNVAGAYQGSNKALEEFLGLPKKEIIGKTVFDIYPQDLAEKYFAMDQDLFHHPGTQVYESGMEQPGGSRRNFIVNKATFLNADGSLGGLIGVLTDITARNQAEEELRAAAHKWRTTFDAMRDAVCLFDQEGKIMQCNQALADLVQKPYAEIIGRPFWELVYGGSAPIKGCPFARMQKSRHRETMVWPKGECWWHLIVDPIFNATGEVAGGVYIIADITEHKLYQDKVHDLNILLRAIKNIDEVLLRVKSEKELFQQTCDFLVNVPFVRFTWIGLAEPDSFKVKPIAWAGVEEDYLSVIMEKRDDAEFILGHTGEGLKTGKAVVKGCIASDPRPNPWREGALKRGYQSSIILPLIHESEVIGILQVYSGKPDAFKDEEINFLNQVAGDIAMGVKSLRLEQELVQGVIKLRIMMLQTVEAIASMAEMRDPYTSGHQQSVMQLACALGKELGLDADRIEGLRVAGFLHDIGKIVVPAEILTKPGKITESELNIIRTHPQAGHDIIRKIDFPWPVAQIVLQHHERLDGSGYPAGMLGQDILLEAKILAVADVVEAMASNRPYRPALGIDKALEEIARNKAILYDPQVVDVCVKLFTEKGFRLAAED